MLENGINENDAKDEFSENIKTIEAVLQRYYCNNNLQILDIKCGPGSKMGDNYMSLIKRIKVWFRDENNSGKYAFRKYQKYRNTCPRLNDFPSASNVKRRESKAPVQA
jgi:hypothetical protein